jgi:hypothetical protein
MHASSTSTLMLDYPGRFTTPNGQAQRAFHSVDAEWVLTCPQASVTFESTIEVVRFGPALNAHPMVDTFDAETLPPPIRQPLKIDATTMIHRVRNPDVWDAMLMPIFRHRIAISDAAKRYRAFCIRYGTVVSTETGTTLLPPRPETVATLDGDLRVVGRRMPALSAAARAYLRLRPDQAPCPPATLHDMMLRIHGIGKASAARIVADTTGDFTFYEHAGFGDRKYWQPHATELSASNHDDLRMLWEVLHLPTALDSDRAGNPPTARRTRSSGSVRQRGLAPPHPSHSTTGTTLIHPRTNRACLRFLQP